MSGLETTTYRVLALDLEIREYPILRDVIHKRMREEMFGRGILREEQFEEEVRLKALMTREREGMREETELAEVWELRCSRVRDVLTDFYFAHNLPHSIFHSIVAEVLGEHNKTNLILNFNPETAPWDLLFAQAAEFESGDEDTRRRTEHHLQEIIAVLTKGMLSDQLRLVGLARRHFRVADLKEINRRRIGRGKVGGKAAGMNMAVRILQTASDGDPMDIGARVRVPESWFVAADVHYEFVERNDLFGGLNEKYKDLDQIREDYQNIRARYDSAHLPESLVRRLGEVLDKVGDAPIVARSSSLLEDSFDTAFAGKYESYFCPNQGDRASRLDSLCAAVKRIYASGLNPDVMAYRKVMGLLDYDERMAVLIQKVEGSVWRDHLLPQVAGVGLSRIPFRVAPGVPRNTGLLRLVWGLGTRAVDRVGLDHPRLVPLSHPAVRLLPAARDGQRYSQRFVDAIDLRNNRMATVPVGQLLSPDYPGVEQIATFQGDQGVISFEPLLESATFLPLMRAILGKLEHAYGHPVDIEFTVELRPGQEPDYLVHVLQCRPQAKREDPERVSIPTSVADSDVVLRSATPAGCGRLREVRYAAFVDPEHYAEKVDSDTAQRIARTLGRLNRRLEGSTWVLIGPGRFGAIDYRSGVPVSYADIFHAAGIVELSIPSRGEEPDTPFGTHFYQDLVETRILPVGVHPQDGDHFDFGFFRGAHNALPELLPAEPEMADHIRVLDIPALTGGRTLELVASDEPAPCALMYLAGQAEN